MSQKVSLSKAYLQLLPIFTFFVSILVWWKTDHATYVANAHVFLIVMNLIFAYLTVCLILNFIIISLLYIIFFIYLFYFILCYFRLIALFNVFVHLNTIIISLH